MIADQSGILGHLVRRQVNGIASSSAISASPKPKSGLGPIAAPALTEAIGTDEHRHLAINGDVTVTTRYRTNQLNFPTSAPTDYSTPATQEHICTA
ncbi:hypothetical protein FBZ96_12015 [Bradyrhizobium stylosanthis]|uniref:Uncharacterized protein n=2 Tax=Bradyrhizobium stylosanthis TaxID=1803665 RepID=A0A560CX40_9BRAD|nr:hypothetical protein FBZ96_12015 [Bradyrhizobium stylosanthis]